MKDEGKQIRLYKEPKLKEQSTDWKANRTEYLIGVGASFFLGDLGGQDGPGKPLLYDLDPTQSRYSITAGARYYVREFHAIRGTATYARVRGTDEVTSYPNRRYRNLNFKSPIIEVSGSYEFHILKPKTIHFMGARTTHLFDGNRFGLYGSIGAGAFIFNPKGKLGDKWYALKPLGTEGQGLPGGPNPYKRIALAFPMGGGVTYLLNYNYKIGIDIGYRWTTTDYVDDASGYFYDNDAIVSSRGKLAGVMANPSVLLDNVPNREWYTENQPRGGSKSNDTYVFTQLTLSHTFTKGISNKEFKPKKKKKAKSFDKGRDKTHKRRNREKKAKSYKNDRIKNKKKKFKAPSLQFKRAKKSKNKVRTF